jgi:hypothetical protein
MAYGDAWIAGDTVVCGTERVCRRPVWADSRIEPA